MCVGSGEAPLTTHCLQDINHNINHNSLILVKNIDTFTLGYEFCMNVSEESILYCMHPNVLTIHSSASGTANINFCRES